MKRINPKTKRLFKMGDKRNDGYVFVGYGSKIRKEGPYKGFYKEGFLAQKNLKNLNRNKQ